MIVKQAEDMARDWRLARAGLGSAMALTFAFSASALAAQNPNPWNPNPGPAAPAQAPLYPNETGTMALPSQATIVAPDRYAPADLDQQLSGNISGAAPAVPAAPVAAPYGAQAPVAGYGYGYAPAAPQAPAGGYGAAPGYGTVYPGYGLGGYPGVGYGSLPLGGAWNGYNGYVPGGTSWPYGSASPLGSW